MKLGMKQQVFAILLGRLLLKADALHLKVRVGEVYRPPEMAAIYAERGQGIKNSLHCLKLAVDLFITEADGSGMWDIETYRKLGEWWEKQHELCCWGGRFKRRDPYHFSLTHQGVK